MSISHSSATNRETLSSSQQKRLLRRRYSRRHARTITFGKALAPGEPPHDFGPLSQKGELRAVVRASLWRVAAPFRPSLRSPGSEGTQLKGGGRAAARLRFMGISWA